MQIKYKKIIVPIAFVILACFIIFFIFIKIKTWLRTHLPKRKIISPALCIRNGQFILYINGSGIPIPFTCSIANTTLDSDKKTLVTKPVEFSFTCLPFKQYIKIQGKFFPIKKIISFSFSTEKIDIKLLKRLLPLINNTLSFSGYIRITGNGTINYNPLLKLQKLDAACYIYEPVVKIPSGKFSFYTSDITTQKNSSAKKNKKISFNISVNNNAVNIVPLKFTVNYQPSDKIIKNLNLAKRKNIEIPINLNAGILVNANNPVRVEDNIRYNIGGTIDLNDLAEKLKLTFNCTGVTEKAKLTLSCTINLPNYRFNLSPDSVPFLKNKEISVSGNISAKLDANLKDKQIKTKAMITFSNTDFGSKKYKIKCEDISGALTVYDLMSPYTAPHQKIRMSRLIVNNIIKIDKPNIDFLLEENSSSAKTTDFIPEIFIEKFTGEWCGGKIYAYSVKIKPESKNYDITVLCDGLKVAEIFKVFKICKAEGKGEINGKIPISISNGKIFFRKGFLYSTPGNGGTIEMTGTEFLTAGIPQNSQRYMQMEFVRQLLRKFTYKWIKLTLNSNKTTCTLKLSMYGYPSGKINIKPINGKYIKVNNKVVFDTPINLDINFNIPLNDIIHYSKPVRKMLNKDQ